MKQFAVLYYDGQTSSAKSANLLLKPHELEIQIQNNESDLQVIAWDLHRIHKIEISGSLHILKYGDFPLQTIECGDEGFLSELKNQYPASQFVKASPLSNIGNQKVIVLALILLGIIGLTYFFALPPAAEFITGKIPQSAEVTFGNSLYEGFVTDSEVDTKLTYLVNDFAHKINFNTTYPLRVTVVKNAQINAFALPGGRIVVYDGILKKMRSSEELAALLAHEVAHIKYKHSLKSISRSLSGYIFISIILNDLNGLSAVLIDNANTLNNLSYSRTLESDADNSALSILKANNLNLNGLVSLFEILNKEANSNKYLKFLSTHPLSEDRLKNALLNAKKQRGYKKNKAMDLIWSQIARKTK